MSPGLQRGSVGSFQSDKSSGTAANKGNQALQLVYLTTIPPDLKCAIAYAARACAALQHSTVVKHR